MIGDFLGSCENHCFLSHTGEANFGETFGKTWATFNFNIWSHWPMECFQILPTFMVPPCR